MFNFELFLCLYPAFLYTLVSFISYKYNSKEYENYGNKVIQVIENIINNLYLSMPIVLLLLFYIFPITTMYEGLYIELGKTFISIISGDIWFYTFHRLFHTKYFYKYHKQHHEFKNPIGISAFYGHWIDVIFVNFGYDFVVHSILGLSFFHWVLVFTIIIINTILNAHTVNTFDNDHVIHHRTSTYNYGVFFMDIIMGTKYYKTIQKV